MALLALLGAVAFAVNFDLRRGLTAEAGRRAEAVARNLAARAVEPLLAPGGRDELTLIQDLRDALQGGAYGGAGTGFQRALILMPSGAPGETCFGYDAQSGVLREPGAAPGAVLGGAFPLAVVDATAAYEFRAPIEASGKRLGEVRLYLRRDVIDSAVRAATLRLAAVMALALAFGLLALGWLVRALFRPIAPLVRGVNAVAAGDFSVRLEPTGSDELGDLVAAFNGMAANLAQKQAIQEALTRYTSRDLVDRMLADKERLDLGGRRVHAAILFSVVKGLRARGQHLDPEHTVALINEYLELETEAVMRNGGSVDKFVGDEVMAVWLQPLDAPEARRRESAAAAVKAALEIQRDTARLNQTRRSKGEEAFEVAVGIHAGEVISGNMGSSVRMDHTLLGSEVNLAARLGLVAAEGGQVLVSAELRRLAEGACFFGTPRRFTLKGITGEIETCEAAPFGSGGAA
jgi:class 3 adenylate cyclase